jgi:hypothetical protein
METREDGDRELPAAKAIDDEREKHLRKGAIEAAVLERDGKVSIRYRPLKQEEIEPGSTR